MGRETDIHHQTDVDINACVTMLLNSLKSIASSNSQTDDKQYLVKRAVKQAFTDFGEKICKRQIDECASIATSIDIKAGSAVSKRSVNMAYEELPF